MSFIKIFFILIFAGGAIAGWRLLKKEYALGKPVAIVCSVLVILLSLTNFSSKKSQIKKINDIEERYNLLCGEQMGKYLAEKYPQQRILIVVRAQDENNPLSYLEEALLEGLQDTLRKEMQKVELLHLERPAAFQAYIDKTIKASPDAYPNGEFDFLHGMPEHMMWFNRKEFRKLAEANRYEYDIILLTMELPFDFNRMKIFQEEDTPRLALINASPRKVQQGMQDEIVVAAIISQPDPKAWKNINKIPSNDLEAFQKRYQLVTPDNIEKLAAKYASHFNY